MRRCPNCGCNLTLAAKLRRARKEARRNAYMRRYMREYTKRRKREREAAATNGASSP
jgi:hypothetical protein